MTTKDDEINSGYTRRVDLTDCHLYFLRKLGSWKRFSRQIGIFDLNR